MGEPVLDPEEFLDRLRRDGRVLKWEPLEPDELRRVPTSDRSRARTSLDYLHGHWALPNSFDPADAGGGAKGRAITLFGRLTFRVLGRYLSAERDLLAHVVRVNEALEQRCDELATRCQQLNEDLIGRQVAEAGNQAKLAAWLHLDPPAAVTSARDGVGTPGGTAPGGTAGPEDDRPGR